MVHDPVPEKVGEAQRRGHVRGEALAVYQRCIDHQPCAWTNKKLIKGTVSDDFGIFVSFISVRTVQIYCEVYF